MHEIAVVHLVRAANGIAPFAAFLRSYIEYPGKLEHDLLIVMKGFESVDMSPYKQLLGGIRHKMLEVPDVGFDITPYYSVAQDQPYDYFLFLNSFSVIEHPDWLAHLHSQVITENTGAVGATGSWESQYSARYGRGGRSAFKHLLRVVRHFFLSRYIPEFPNPHIRTNAFMVARETILRTTRPRIVSKRDAYSFESGIGSFTRQLARMGKTVAVVGRDGKAYAPSQWPASRTFRIGEEDNLLISDNQTRQYLSASPILRRRMSEAAWGSDTGFKR
jgi:hypothetical protein